MRLPLVLIIVPLLIAAGCDGGSEEITTQPPKPTSTAAAVLERAVRAAISDNRRLSVYVLANNRIPTWATRSTRGPALAGLRRAATDRKKRGVRVRLLSDRFEIVSIRLDPSFARATAFATARQRVRPLGRNGKPIGGAIELREMARLELRRLGRAERFVVWRVRVQQ